MQTVSFFTMHDWNIKNKNFQSLSEGLDAVDKEVIYILCQHFILNIDGFHSREDFFNKVK